MTSCCPAWVKLVTDQYPDYKENLSTCRSPQGMMSAVTKEWFRDTEHAGGKRTVIVSFMPCTAKKMEIKRSNSFTKGEQDTDYVKMCIRDRYTFIRLSVIRINVYCAA